MRFGNSISRSPVAFLPSLKPRDDGVQSICWPAFLATWEQRSNEPRSSLTTTPASGALGGCGNGERDLELGIGRRTSQPLQPAPALSCWA